MNKTDSVISASESLVELLYDDARDVNIELIEDVEEILSKLFDDGYELGLEYGWAIEQDNCQRYVEEDEEWTAL